jgi:hypothetical protein
MNQHTKRKHESAGSWIKRPNTWIEPRKRASAIFLAVCAVGLGLSGSAQGSGFATFSAPGAGTAAGQGTWATAINASGESTGFYWDSNWGRHGFLRARNGHIVTFDAPGSCATWGSSINSSGVIAGVYLDGSCSFFQAFLRDPGGVITTIDAPGAGTGNNQGTFAESIDPSGAIAGNYVDASNVNHGFLRDPTGDFTTFDITGSTSLSIPYPASLSPSGAITGYYFDANSVGHGFLRTRSGTIKTFEVTGGAPAPARVPIHQA